MVCEDDIDLYHKAMAGTASYTGYSNLGLDLRGTGPKGSRLLMLSFDERFEQVQVTRHRQGIPRYDR